MGTKDKGKMRGLSLAFLFVVAAAFVLVWSAASEIQDGFDLRDGATLDSHSNSRSESGNAVYAEVQKKFFNSAAFFSSHQKLISRTGKCVNRKGSRAYMGGCRGKTAGWKFSRLTGRISQRGLCLTRRGVSVSATKCGKNKRQISQKWRRKCGTFVSFKGVNVLTANGRGVRMKKWKGGKAQLWSYKEVFKHKKCRNKPYKVMRFNGSTRTAVQQKNFLGMPRKRLTVGMWVKANRAKGTLVSYASKHHARSFVITNQKGKVGGQRLNVFVMDQKIMTPIRLPLHRWLHIAVTWDSAKGWLKLYINARLRFKKAGIKSKASITPAGCLMLGQLAKKQCKQAIKKYSFSGLISDFMVWRSVLPQKKIRQRMKRPVSKQVVVRAGKLNSPKPPSNMRIAWLTRQYAKEEQGVTFPPRCDLTDTGKKGAKKHKKKVHKKAGKKITGPRGFMRWGGAGDVHYHSFAHCFYDDQSIGEWTALRVKKAYYARYPLTVQYRTSPNAQRCSWCQNGAVAFIDGCAVRYKSEQASAGFGGFNFPNSHYPAYAAFKGKRMVQNKWTRGKYMRVKAYTSGRKSYGWRWGNFKAILTDGTQLACGKGSISLTVPKKLTGKIEGIAGNGIKKREWAMGPNTKASKGARPGMQTKGMANICKHHYQYTKPRSPFNGNSVKKPLVKWFKSWQVDGKIIPSVFYYQKGRGAGSFNRVAGQKLKPVASVMKKRPKGAKAKAKKKCHALRKNKKALAKCIYDYMVLGKSAVKKSIRDRMTKRLVKGKRANGRSVRDLSRWRNDGKWVSNPSWACVGNFRSGKKVLRSFRKGKKKGKRKGKMKGKTRKAFKVARKTSKAHGKCVCRRKWHGSCSYDYYFCIASKASMMESGLAWMNSMLEGA